MDDLKLATTLDPCFKLDWCQNYESCDVHDLLTSQMVQLSPTTPAECMELEMHYLELINLIWNGVELTKWN